MITITIEHDESPMNPWEDWDCEPPIIAHTRDGIQHFGDVGLPRFTPGQLRRHAPALRELMGCATRDAYRDEYGGMPLDEALSDYETYRLNNTDRLDFYEALYAILRIPTYRGTRNGYTKGCWADLLVIGCPRWAERVGAKPKPDTLRHTADLWGWRAWGDVYYYTITHDDGTEDSCGGFYGPHGRSGILDAIREALS